MCQPQTSEALHGDEAIPLEVQLPTNAEVTFERRREQIDRVSQQGVAEPDPLLGALIGVEADLLGMQLYVQQSVAAELQRPPESLDDLASKFPIFSASKELSQQILRFERVRQGHLARREQQTAVDEMVDTMDQILEAVRPRRRCEAS